MIANNMYFSRKGEKNLSYVEDIRAAIVPWPTDAFDIKFLKSFFSSIS